MSGRLAVVANLLLLGAIAWFGWLRAAHPAAYYVSVQEDQALEWASFWSFFVAGVVFAIAARRRRRATGTLPWFFIGLAVFCVLVAMEEISWGQRVFGHRPPDYFLAENYQQEINLHNIVGTELRMGVFRAIILGYGVLLPLVALIPYGRRVLDRLGIVAPPIELTPAMFALFWVHLQYPWKFTAEIIEGALGFAFLFVGMVSARRFARPSTQASLAAAAGLPVLVITLGFATAAWSQNRQSSDPGKLKSAQAEIQALADDFVAAAEAHDEAAVTHCDLHTRLYTFTRQNQEYAQPLRSGAFASMADAGVPEARAEFFVDPWNSPYWIRDRCDENSGRRVIFIYSFGPNRSRDSSRWELLDDDIGHYLRRDSDP